MQAIKLFTGMFKIFYYITRTIPLFRKKLSTYNKLFLITLTCLAILYHFQYNLKTAIEQIGNLKCRN